MLTEKTGQSIEFVLWKGLQFVLEWAGSDGVGEVKKACKFNVREFSGFM